MADQMASMACESETELWGRETDLKRSSGYSGNTMKWSSGYSENTMKWSYGAHFP